MSKNYGLIGIDVSYVIATVGTMFMAVFFVIGDRQFYLTQHVGSYYLFLDFFPALLVFMSGLSFAIKMKDKKSSTRRMLANSWRKGSLLFLIGLIFVSLWSVNMFILLGMCFMAAGLVGKLSEFLLRSLAVLVLFLSVVSLSLDVPIYPMFSSLKLQGAGLKEVMGFVFFNGYFSFLPWFGFFVMGMIFGRGSIRPNGWFPPSSIVGLSLIILALILEVYTRKTATPSPGIQDVGFYPLNVRLFMPAFVLLHSGTCIIVVNMFNYLYRKSKNRLISDTCRKLVESRYSLYFSVFFCGAIVMGLFNLIIFKQAVVLIIIDFLLCLFCVYLILTWKKYLTAKPPIEWLIQRVSIATRD